MLVCFTFDRKHLLNQPEITRTKLIWFGSDDETFHTLTGNGTFRIWDTETGNMLSSTTINADLPIYVAAISPDRTTLAIADADSTLVLLELPLGS